MRHLVAIFAGLLLPVTAFAVPVLEITDGTMNVGAMRVGTGVYVGGGRFDFGGEGFRLDSASSYRFFGGPENIAAPIVDVRAGFYDQLLPSGAHRGLRVALNCGNGRRDWATVALPGKPA